MEWIVEAETLSDFIDHGRYTIASKPLIRCKDCKHYKALGYSGKLACHNVGLLGGTVEKKPDDFCSRAERRSDE